MLKISAAKPQNIFSILASVLAGNEQSIESEYGKACL